MNHVSWWLTREGGDLHDCNRNKFHHSLFYTLFIWLMTVDRKALEDIFDLSDLDGNGTMSREEFNWYNIRTSDEEVGDDEWEVVEGEKSF